MRGPGPVAVVAVGVAAGALVVTEPRGAVLLAGLAAGLATAAVVGSRASARGDDVVGLAWAATAFTAPFSGIRVASSMALSDVFLAFAVAAMLASMALRRRWSLAATDDAVLVGLGTIVAGGLIGTAFAIHADASLLEIAKFLLASAGSILAARMWAPGAARIRWFCTLWLAGAVASALWALTLSERIVGRPLGLTTHPNHLGLACLLAAAMALGFALGDRPRARRVALLSLVPLVGALVASGSRAALLGFFVMVPTVAALTHRIQLAMRAVAVAAVFAVAALAGVVDVPADTGLARFFGEAASESNALRIEHLSTSIDRFERHPLTGEGFEFAQEAHNIYLQVLAAGGPLGLIGLVLVAGSILGSVRGGAGGSRSGARAVGDRALLAGMVGGYAGYLVVGLFQNILWDRYLWLYVAGALSLAASLRQGEVAVTPDAGTDSRSRPPDPVPAASPAAGPGATPAPPASGWPR